MKDDTGSAVPAETRRLAAIMFTDIAGFSRQMGTDKPARCGCWTSITRLFSRQWPITTAPSLRLVRDVPWTCFRLV